MKDTAQYKQLKEAMELIRELKIPDHLQEKALTHLLQGAAGAQAANRSAGRPSGGGDTEGLLEFIDAHRPKGAVEEIPALLFWAWQNENTDSFNEDDIIALYRRADIRPPKHVAQSMRDLTSKKYLRLRAVPGNTGHVALSRTGEDFVRYKLMKRKQS